MKASQPHAYVIYFQGDLEIYILRQREKNSAREFSLFLHLFLLGGRTFLKVSLQSSAYILFGKGMSYAHPSVGWENEYLEKGIRIFEIS